MHASGIYRAVAEIEPPTLGPCDNTVGIISPPFGSSRVPQDELYAVLILLGDPDARVCPQKGGEILAGRTYQVP